MIAEQLEARIGSENAKLLEARANKRVIAHEVAFLEKEFLRVQKLLEKGVISRSRVERVEANFRKAQQNNLSRQKDCFCIRGSGGRGRS